MDVKQAWSNTTEKTKSGWRASATGGVNVADALSPAFAPFAQRWDAEADRRQALRTPENLKRLMDAQRAHTSARSTAAAAKSQREAARKASSNPLSSARRAARTADKAARGHRAQAKTALQQARASYPETLLRRAVEAHAVHAVPAGIVSYALSTAQDWTVWPASVSAALIGLNVAGLWLGRRTVSVHVEDGLSAEERQLVARLDPSFWVGHADERGLAGTVTTPPAVGAAGIECEVRLDGTWTVAKLRSAEDSVRALLGCRTSLPLRISNGKRGGWAVITLRTRSAADGADLAWSPGAAFGVDTVTGEDAVIPLGQRMLIAGRSGAGKSWSARPLLFEASEGDANALVVIDLKQVEGRLWDHRARVATTPADVVALVAELVEEMTERLALIPKGEDTLTPTAERPRITVFVDEGAEIVTSAKEALAGLESIARMGRAPIIDLWWTTQKPTMSGASAGIPAQIAPQLSTVVALAVSTPTEARTVLGEDAQAKGWNADQLPAPGYALVRDGRRKPNPVRTRALSPKQVVALPDRPIWRRVPAPAPTGGLTLVKADEAVPAPVDADLTDNQRAVLKVVRDGATSNAEISKATGLNPGSVDRAVKALAKRGLLAKSGSDITAEVSA